MQSGTIFDMKLALFLNTDNYVQTLTESVFAFIVPMQFLKLRIAEEESIIAEFSRYNIMFMII